MAATTAHHSHDDDGHGYHGDDDGYDDDDCIVFDLHSIIFRLPTPATRNGRNHCTSS